VTSQSMISFGGVLHTVRSEKSVKIYSYCLSEANRILMCALKSTSVCQYVEVVRPHSVDLYISVPVCRGR